MLLSSISLALTRLGQRLGRWSPLALWPNGIATPGMWISPRTLTSEWQDSAGTTPVSVPGTVADSSNPVGLALDIRAGATVLTDPGTHMLQSTSAARPLLSARVNLLTYTEDFSNAAWWTGGTTVSTNTGVAPDGTTTADTLIANATPGEHRRIQRSAGKGKADGVASFYVKAKEYGFAFIGLAESNATLYKGALVDLSNGAVVSNSANAVEVVDVGSGWYRVSVQVTVTDLDFYGLVAPADSAAVTLGPFGPSFTGDGTSGIYVWGGQVEFGTTVLDYQSVPGDGSTYPSTGFPIAQKYDGVDDGMATAAFAAGTLIDGMDCMIPVRRDSAASCVAGLYNGIADATKFFGMAESGSGSGCVGSGAGTPTVWVDNAQLTGGTAVTRGTLHTALTVGDVHILEFRDLDLSTWTASGFGLYTGYLLNGARGDIMLYPSTASTEDKDAARQWLADYYGVTLP